MGKNYKQTVVGCFFGIVNQSVITNITAILFVPFMQLYGFEIWQLGVLVGLNFISQLAADILLSLFIDKIRFRTIVLIASSLSVVGLIIYGSVCFFIPTAMAYGAILAATGLFAFSSGMLEVVLSPIVDNLPDTAGGKGTAMSLMHSFYAWGQAGCVVITTLFLAIFGNQNWGVIVMLFALIPVVSFLLFTRAPIDQKQVEKTKGGVSKVFFSTFFQCALLAIMLGAAAELVMSQYVSTFLVTGVGLSKQMADLAGMCVFAVGMGSGRAIYGKFGAKWSLSGMMIVCSFLSAACYLAIGFFGSAIVGLIASLLCGFAVSLLWPGTLVSTSRFFPQAGAWIFAVLAVAGDLGGVIFPTVTGFLADSLGLKVAFIIMAAMPLLSGIMHLILRAKNKKAGVPD